MSSVRDALYSKAFMDRVRQLVMQMSQPVEHPSQVARRELSTNLSLDDLEDELKRQFARVRAGRG